MNMEIKGHLPIINGASVPAGNKAVKGGISGQSTQTPLAGQTGQEPVQYANYGKTDAGLYRPSEIKKAENGAAELGSIIANAVNAANADASDERLAALRGQIAAGQYSIPGGQVLPLA